MNVPEHVDRLTDGSAGNETENLLLLSLGRRRTRRKQRNAANVSATPFSLLKKQEGGEKDFWKRATRTRTDQD